jgi:hypothetical protein
MDNIFSILKNNFFPKYCTEKYLNILPEETVTNMAIPMVSFCDIPLSQVKEHIKEYGNYGIGLKKSWGIDNKINPVFYAVPNTSATYCIGNILKMMNAEYTDYNRSLYSEYGIYIRDSEDTILFKKVVEMLNLLSFIKPYEGISKSGKKKRFYDEKEWRYVPDMYELKKKSVKGIIPEQEWEKTEIYQKKEYNKRLEDFKLNFQPKDIQYIIINKESEILEMIDKVRETKDKYQYSDVEVLTTRIISMEQILSDF